MTAIRVALGLWYTERMAAQSGTHTQGQSGAQSASMRCVVWCAQGVALDGQLQAALGARQELRASVVTSCFAALAELLISGAEGEPRVLVLQEPATLAGAAEVLARLERHLPSAKVWVFTAQPKPTLRGLRAGDLVVAGRAVAAEQSFKRVPQVVVVPGIGAKLRGEKQEWTPRVVGEGLDKGGAGPETRSAQSGVPDNSQPAAMPPAAGNPSGSSVGGVRPTSLLSDEELSMLLANDQNREHT